jgi:hypothetical protein
MAIKHYFVGFYKVQGIPEPCMVETPLEQNASENHKRLLAQVRAKYPGCHESLITRLSTKIESRDETDPGYIDDIPGTTLRGLFTEGDSDEPYCKVGSVFWEGESWDISLRYHRAKAMIGVVLVNRITGNPARFTQQFQANQLLAELPRLMREVLPGARELKFNFKSLVMAHKQHNEHTHIPGEVIAPKTKLK